MNIDVLFLRKMIPTSIEHNWDPMDFDLRWYPLYRIACWWNGERLLEYIGKSESGCYIHVRDQVTKRHFWMCPEDDPAIMFKKKGTLVQYP